ncbi:MAG: MBL fold metallo-hydrolase [Firmicutes bacterium]|nr:MBL fold metallo-hydrolase [Bacillota bacterium]
MSNTKIITLNKNAMNQNSYIYCDINKNICVVIDPGYNAQAINLAVDDKFEIAAILLTHGHYDHIMETAQISQSCQIYSHEDELQVLKDPQINLSSNTETPIKFIPHKFFKDGEKFTFGGVTLTVLHIPGHTPGGACFYDEKNNVVFTGDSLFKAAIGYAHFPLSNEKLLVTSIKQKLLTLPPNTVVYPGHDEPTTIGEELQFNPFLQ